MPYTLPKLTYSYQALEPYLDALTMEIHHTKHHQTYIDKLNGVMEKHPALQKKKLEDVLRDLTALKIDEADKKMIRNHGGGHLNHSLFWNIMGPSKHIDDKLIVDIEKTFVSVAEFKKAFSLAALSHFGSGWAWLVRDEKNQLQVYALPNQDSPYLTDHTPIIGLDVWEHAYYLKYQNRRQEYIDNWWNVLTLI